MDTAAGMFRLDGRVALVTGAGSGMGLETARALARQGACVVVNDLDADLAQDAAADLRATGAQAFAAPGDVVDEHMAHAVVTAAVEEFGRLDVLVNNVGGSGGSAVPLEETSLETWRRVFDLNVTGTFLCTRSAVPHLRRNGGRVVVISSMAGVSRAFIGGVSYSAAKAALLGFTRQLAAELAPSRVTVNAVAPGIIEQDRIVAAFDAHPDWSYEEVLARIPTGAAGRIDDVAAAVVYLASPEAAYVTGVTLEVNGGISMR